MPDQPIEATKTVGPDPLRERPKWFTPWASQLAELYFSGTTAAFVLHGNTYDFVRIGDGDDARYGVLSEFLAEQLFGRWSLVLHYDLGRGLRVLAGRDEQRLKDMVDPRESQGRRSRARCRRIRQQPSPCSTGSCGTTSWRRRPTA